MPIKALRNLLMIFFADFFLYVFLYGQLASGAFRASRALIKSVSYSGFDCVIPL